MKRCAFCNKTFLFQGKTVDGQIYCNDECVRKSVLRLVANELPQDMVDQYVNQVHSGICPKCSGRRPVDVYQSHLVYSFLLFTSWKSQMHICCRSCATKKQAGAAFLSLIIGWWGFPWGIIMTPVQIIRNLIDLFRNHDPNRPSVELRGILLYTLAENVVKEVNKRNAESQAAVS